MADEIRADYERLGQVASKFANQAQTIAQVLQSVRSSKDKLEQGGWIGKGSSAFFKEMNGTVLPATQRLQQALSEASQKTKEISDTVKQADEEAGAGFQGEE